MSWTDEALLDRMTRGWSGGLRDGTPCGGGSTLKASKNVSEQLPLLVERHGIQSVCDAGAGDMHWIRHVRWDVDYRPFDIVGRPGVEVLDITKELLPLCDLILCRHVLIHFDPPRIEKTLELFSHSAKFLLASQYDNRTGFDAGNQYNPTDLRKWLGEPIERIQDTGSDLALWAL